MKTKTLKLISKALLVIILATSVLSLSSCGGPNIFGYYNNQSCSEEYYSHKEFQNFIEKYNSKNDGFVATFISFDFDSNENITNKCYRWGKQLKLNKYFDVMFDKYQDYIGIGMYFYMNGFDEKGDLVDNKYQIFCVYSYGKINFNFDKNDEIVLMKFDENSTPIYFNELKSMYFYNPTSLTYNYAQSYCLNVNGIKIMEISIASLDETISQEKLDEICQLLMDNIVIINTEV